MTGVVDAGHERGCGEASIPIHEDGTSRDRRAPWEFPCRWRASAAIASPCRDFRRRQPPRDRPRLGLRCHAAGRGTAHLGIAEVDTPDAPPDERQSEKLLACARTMLPDMAITKVSNWMGVRPSTPDSLPIICPHEKYAAILFTTAHGHMASAPRP
ncbi:FAD-dependent oxidoreductase [Mesorhizobium sp. AaZ16]|uniref:FAD-dependent oxidoreductase n=1 Tax=Mesorhizobium sp. AaZ16 TaxID=3402289 RepID=UPI00374E30E0